MTGGYDALWSWFPLLKSHAWLVLQWSQFSDWLNLLVSIHPIWNNSRRKHTCTHSHYTSKRPHSFPNFGSWRTQARTWCLLFGLQKWSCQLVTERSQGRQCWRSDAPCQSRKHSVQRTQKIQFDRSFEAKCWGNFVPPSLVSLVNMILYGPNIEVSSLKLVLPSLSCYSTTPTNKSSSSGTPLA